MTEAGVTAGNLLFVAIVRGEPAVDRLAGFLGRPV
jgi:hypothetical protein